MKKEGMLCNTPFFLHYQIANFKDTRVATQNLYYFKIFYTTDQLLRLPHYKQ